MNVVKVNNIKLGEGIPKIAVPIVGKTKYEILKEAKEINSTLVDIVEWRVDWFDNAFEYEKVEDILVNLKEALGDIPILFTFRTSKEGGEKKISSDIYEELNKYVINRGLIELLDVEAFTGDEVVKRIIECASKNNVKIILSNHDFLKTPPKEEIIARFMKMQDLGAHILKIAVMPQSKSDVLELLQATTIMYEKYATQPIIAISMDKIGMISRFSGEVFGSCITFGCTDKLSAPGQVNAKDLKSMLKIIHENI